MQKSKRGLGLGGVQVETAVERAFLLVLKSQQLSPGFLFSLGGLAFPTPILLPQGPYAEACNLPAA